jgi:quercetin dioxygenase-like cupin family protein
MMHDIAISQILNVFERSASEICRGDLSFAEQAPFVGTKVQKAPNGSTVITVAITEAVLDQLPASHRYIDLFLLESGRELGPHHHKLATAHVYGIEGSGTAVIGDQSIELGRADKAVFPVGVTHNVVTGDDFLLFASFQNHSIIREDGSLDYFVDI